MLPILGPAAVCAYKSRQVDELADEVKDNSDGKERTETFNSNPLNAANNEVFKNKEEPVKEDEKGGVPISEANNVVLKDGYDGIDDYNYYNIYYDYTYGEDEKLIADNYSYGYYSYYDNDDFDWS
ncbi:MAG: hypothetical protein FWC41_05675 [Firmicutes bacterium]|nr:hypothetical protein [Bacillota bacterium]